MSDFSTFNPIPSGSLERLHSWLFYLPRLTQYQYFCLQIAEKSLDLPVFDWHDRRASPDKMLRHLDGLHGWAVQRWILEAARLNGLAAMVLLDAMDFFSGCLDFLTQNHGTKLFDSRFKRDFTDAIHGLPFVFRIPPGWELSFNNDKYDEGNYGVAVVVRCHLSQRTTHVNWALGELLGRGNAPSTDIGYFDIPCDLVQHFKRMPIDVDDERWRIGRETVTASIPYQWIIQTRKWNHNDKRFHLQAVPSENDILDVAVTAIAGVKEQIVKIQARSQQAENGKLSDRERDE